MKVYCIEEFPDELRKLKKKKSYRDVEKRLAEYFFPRPDVTVKEVAKGSIVNHDPDVPFFKKRLRGSGGYRVLFIGLVVNDIIFLTTIYPKTGDKGKGDLETDERLILQEKTRKAMEQKKGLIVQCGADGKSLEFEKRKKPTKVKKA